MAKKKRKPEKATLAYPKHAFQPEEVLDFIYLDGFLRDWRKLRLSELDLAALRIIIMCHPKGSPVIKGTGGLRKLRFSVPRSNKGKRGGVRVGYAFFEEHSLVALVIAYPKNRKDDLTQAEINEISKLLQGIEKALEEGIVS